MFKEYDYDNVPVVEIVNMIIIDAINKKASDIHFDPTSDTLNVRLRIDGELLDYAKVPASVKKNLTTRIKIISGMNITETRLPQDGAVKKLDHIVKNQNNQQQSITYDIDLRVSSLPITEGEKIVIRILDYKMSSAGLDNLNFSQNNLDKVKKMISLPNGIILISGATGTGKSTTLYSMLQALNTSTRNIITVEDPVEMKIEGINQVQVMSEIGLNFANTLRSILRQDPDVVMIGEIRDDETARIAVRASITGHLVLSTIHTNNSLNTIERLLDMEIERYLLGSALSGIIAQRLVKKLCPKCRTARETTPYEKILFKEVLGLDVNAIYQANGCEECIKGYRGRIPIQEVLLINQEIKDAISTGMSKQDLRVLVYKNDAITTLIKDGLSKLLEGNTTIDEIMRVIDIEEDLKGETENLKNAFLGKETKTETPMKAEYSEEEVESL